MLTAGEFCNRDVVIATANERVADVARLMREHHVGSVVIVEQRSMGKVPVGILTDRDIVVGLVALEPSYLDRALVSDLLTGKVVTARDDADLSDVVVRMRSHGVRRIPVVDQTGVLQGIIAFDDLLEHIAGELHRLAALLQREEEREQKQRPSLDKASPRI